MSVSAIYKIFAEEVASIDFACGPGCATCCTRSVTLTTGEGRQILDYLRQQGRDLPMLPHDEKPLRSALTTNGLARLYLAGHEPEAETEPPWLFEPCFFLRDGFCAIYEARPFACRSFGSTLNCAAAGTAEVPAWYPALAIVVNQVLEDLDRGGSWGNLADVLAFLSGQRGSEGYPATGRLLSNLPVPGFLLLPEEQEIVARLIERIGFRSGC